MSDQELSNISRTNWATLEAMDDEGIDYSDIPPLTEEFFEKATLRIPITQAQQFVQLEPREYPMHSEVGVFAESSRFSPRRNQNSDFLVWQRYRNRPRSFRQEHRTEQ
jgi:hypothetical protein